jgi:hypothetical protein
METNVLRKELAKSCFAVDASHISGAATMNRPFLVILFLLVAAFGLSAQTPSTTPAPASPSAASGQSADTAQTPVTSGTKKTTIGSGAQTDAGTPAQNTSPNGTGPVTPSGTLKTTTQVPATPGSADAAQTPAPQEGNTALSSSDLQSQIQNALTKEPTLSANSLQVNVTDENIELSGNVENAREKQTALRIVQSYAANKKVVNHITVGARSDGPSQTEPAPNHPDNTNPPANPEPNKGSRPPL